MFDTPMRAILRTCLQLIEKEQVEERKMINGDISQSAIPTSEEE